MFGGPGNAPTLTSGKKVYIFILLIGLMHDFPERQNRDKVQNVCMEDSGYQVIRFHHAENWVDVVKKFPSVFGSLA